MYFLHIHPQAYVYIYRQHRNVTNRPTMPIFSHGRTSNDTSRSTSGSPARYRRHTPRKDIAPEYTHKCKVIQVHAYVYIRLYKYIYVHIRMHLCWAKSRDLGPGGSRGQPPKVSDTVGGLLIYNT